MLQITTGKLFTHHPGIENSLRAILYTNLRLGYGRESSVSGPIYGSLKQSSELDCSPKVLIYEFTERIEQKPGPGVIASYGADPYVQDMAMVLSLVFNCTCSPDIDLVRRLISAQRGTATGKVPHAMVRRVFDKEIFLQPGDSSKFTEFVAQLLGLERKTYLGVMRAIRTYVTGLHRVADDLELAYTLMVAAAESLTQDFDGYTSDWESVMEQKRKPIDEALIGAADEIAHRVRNAIVETEHVALGRRFQAFVAAHVSPAYFKGPFEVDASPPGRSELPELLASAYRARSKYVHQLQRLPDMVTMGYGHYETILPIEDRHRMLTLQGLARLVRDVIMSFVRGQPTVDKEIYDYSRELANVVFVRLGGGGWIANADGDITKVGRVKLEAFAEQVAGAFTGVQNAAVEDLSELLKKFKSLAAGMRPVDRRPYFAMLILFNRIAGEKWISGTSALERLMQSDLQEPSAEALLVHAILDEPAQWTNDEYHSAFQSYRRRRSNSTGLRLPRLFEAAIGLVLAERYRVEGDIERCRVTAALVADDYPENASLRDALTDFAIDKPLKWLEILTPKRATESTPATKDDVVKSVKNHSKPHVHSRKETIKKTRLRKNISSHERRQTD